MSGERAAAAAQAFRAEWAKAESGDIWTAALSASDEILFSSEALDRVAQTILEEVEPAFDWATANREHRKLYTEVARAVFSALRHG